VCDTLAAVGTHGTLFAKNSDRPAGEVQIIEAFARRSPGSELHTQYLAIPDAGAAALIGSRPTWLWGLEHGVNEHRVAIGNERVFTVDDASAAPAALTGMDLVRLGLERGANATEALDVITALLERHGQGGACDEAGSDSYFSSFLVADPSGAWILETSGRRWAARAVEDGAAISNRLTLGSTWDRASSDVAPGTDLDTWRDPEVDPARADVRLAATRACLATAARGLNPGDLAATLRHHGHRPWGAPGSDPAVVDPPPYGSPTGAEGASVCWHVREVMSTTAAMIAELPTDPATPAGAWFALGSPCASIFVPASPPADVPNALSDAGTWQRFAALRDRVEADGDALVDVRAVLGPVEADLWAHPRDPWPRVHDALVRLGV
jgi:secernin